jgi:hypothetical protein
VITSSDQGTNVAVRIVPRLDLVAIAEEMATDPKDKKRKKAIKKSSARPMARLFDKNEVTQLVHLIIPFYLSIYLYCCSNEWDMNGENDNRIVGELAVVRKKGTNDESFYYYFNNKKFKQGFLHTTTNIRQLV